MIRPPRAARRRRRAPRPRAGSGSCRRPRCPRRRAARTASRIAARVDVSAPAVGSSSSTTRGRWTSAIAVCSRRCSPPESRPAGRSASSVSTNGSSSRSARAARRAGAPRRTPTGSRAPSATGRSRSPGARRPGRPAHAARVPASGSSSPRRSPTSVRLARAVGPEQREHLARLDARGRRRRAPRRVAVALDDPARARGLTPTTRRRRPDSRSKSSRSQTMNAARLSGRSISPARRKPRNASSERNWWLRTSGSPTIRSTPGRLNRKRTTARPIATRVAPEVLLLADQDVRADVARQHRRVRAEHVARRVVDLDVADRRCRRRSPSSGERAGSSFWRTR